MDFKTKKLLGIVSAGALIIILMRTKRLTRQKQTWCRRWISRRHKGRGVLSMLDQELRPEDPNAYRNFLRMNSDQFQYVLNLIETRICRQDTTFREAISAKNRLEVTLRFLATGETFRSLMYSTRIHESTISRIIPEVCNAIYESFKDKYLQVPATESAWRKIAHDFYDLWQYPHCLGALDGRHITFRPPISDGSYYFNYKGDHSIVLLGLVDANYRFIYVNVGVNGRISDGGVFHSSALSQAMMTNQLHFPPPDPLPGKTLPVPYVVIADDAFPLRNNLMKPFPHRGLSYECKIHNYRLSRARRVVENAFGILANRFRVLLNPINLSVEKVEKITLACVALHNFLVTENNNLYVNINLSDIDHTLPRVGQQGSNMSAISARSIREEFKHFFTSPEGSVPWQETAVRNSILFYTEEK